MTNTEKKIAEIREALEKATPGPWRVIKKAIPVGYAEFEVAWSDDGELVCDVVYEEADAHLIANAPEWLRFLIQAVEMYRELMHELDKENDHLHEKINELEKLKHERNKLIEGLRWYADFRNWAGDVFAPPEGIPPEVDDGGQRARDILKEIGVNVDA